MQISSLVSARDWSVSCFASFILVTRSPGATILLLFYYYYYIVIIIIMTVCIYVHHTQNMSPELHPVRRTQSEVLTAVKRPCAGLVVARTILQHSTIIQTTAMDRGPLT